MPIWDLNYIMFLLSPTPLQKLILKNKLTSPQSGAVAAFEGLVRNHNDGKKVIALEYEVFDKLAVKEANEIFKEAKSKFAVLEVKCFHRVGKLVPGEMAVRVGVSAAHRDSAFKACRYIIDEIKTRLPIWKKEYYENGDSGWVNCEGCVRGHTHVSIQFEKDCFAPTKSVVARNDTDEKTFYSRQTLLPEIGEPGQKKLKKSKVLVVGAGGLGSAVLQYLTGAGVGTLGICEFDTLEPHNLHRQPLYSYNDLNQKKCQLAANRIQSLNPFIKIQTHPQKISPQNVEEMTASYDLLLDCADNFAAKFLLNDVSFFKKIPLIQASIYQFEGQLRVYHPSNRTACLRCLWPQIPSPDCIGNCAETGVLGIIPGILGSMQALETVKWILNLPDQLKNETLLFDLRDYTLRRIKQKPNLSCPLCGNSPSIKSMDEKNYTTSAMTNAGIDVDIFQLKPKDFSDYKLVDIREKAEGFKNPVNFKRCLKTPLSEIKAGRHTFDPQQKYLFFCGKGIRSHRLAEEMQGKGIMAFSILSGVVSVKRYINRMTFSTNH